MRNALVYACFLLIPVIFLLFIALRMRRKISYPHGLILIDKKNKPTDFLIRFLRLYGDLFFDLLLAVSVAFILAGYPETTPKTSAVILDSSLSMTRGMPGTRPIDLACRELFNNAEYASADLFLLEYDGISKTTRLLPANKLKKDFGSSLSLVQELERRNSFFSIDYSALSRLRDSPYKKITLLTDNENINAGRIEIKPIKIPRIELSYPAQASFDTVSNASIVHFYSKDSSRLERILYMDGDSRLMQAKPDSFRIEKSPSGFVLHIKNPGVWALQENGYVLPFEAPGPVNPAKAEGLLATKISDIISNDPQTAPQGGPQLLISEKQSKQNRNLLRIAVADTDTCVFNPAKTLGALVASGYKEAADITLTPASFASADSSLVFLTELYRNDSSMYSFTAKNDFLIRMGDGYLVQKKNRTGALSAGPEEYFPFSVTVALAKPELQVSRYLIFIFLSVVFALKAFFNVKKRV